MHGRKNIKFNYYNIKIRLAILTVIIRESQFAVLREVGHFKKSILVLLAERIHVLCIQIFVTCFKPAGYNRATNGAQRQLFKFRHSEKGLVDTTW